MIKKIKVVKPCLALSLNNKKGIMSILNYFMIFTFAVCLGVMFISFFTYHDTEMVTILFINACYLSIGIITGWMLKDGTR